MWKADEDQYQTAIDTTIHNTLTNTVAASIVKAKKFNEITKICQF